MRWHLGTCTAWASGSRWLFADTQGCELPSPDLVDAIYQAADCKIDGGSLRRTTDGTPSTMSSPTVLEAQAKRIESRIDVWKAAHGREPVLVAGTHKDIARADRDYVDDVGRVLLHAGGVGLYGWQRANGTVLQPPYGKHASSWCDYSQGLRLCKRLDFAT